MIDEEKTLRSNPPVVELDLPVGEAADGFFERYFGTRVSPDGEIPDDADVDAAYVIKLK